MFLALLAAVSLMGMEIVAGGNPAAAQGRISVSPAHGLDPAGAFVVVSGAGFVPNSQLFVMQCRATSGDDHTCNSVGLRKVTTDASGSFTANAMRVVANFGATDCLASGCAVMTSAVSGHSGDRSQDARSAISFRAAPPVTPAPIAPPAPTPPPATQPPDLAPGAPAPVPAAPDETSGSTTTADPGSTTTAESTSTTAVTSATVDGGSSTGPSTTVAGGDRPASAAAAPGDGSDGGSSSVPIIAGVVIALAVAVGGTVLWRRRSAA